VEPLDGYTRRIRILGNDEPAVVFYRPATRDEAKRFRFTIRYLNAESAKSEICEWIAKHIVHSDLLYPSIDVFDECDERACETLFKAINGVIPDMSGRCWAGSDGDEVLWERNLRMGVRFTRDYPELARRSCDLCQKWWFKTDGSVVHSGGKPQLRQDKPPCRERVGCPKGTPENQRTLNKANAWAWKHFCECRAIGQFPDDAIVRKNARIITEALQVKAKVA